ncbi:MAG: HAD family hydrolase [Deltaproteobacteria bacterium]|nr:HAD family hydrolase [Deltaproteobacteria bacterium]
MRAILFDFGGTLDFPRHWLDRFVAHYQMAGIDIERAELDLAFSATTQKAYACSEMLRDYSLLQLVGFLVELQFENLGMCDAAAPRRLSAEACSGCGINELKMRIRDAFMAESAVGFAMSRPLLNSFARHLKIGVVSNFYGNLDRVITEADLAPSITVIADSGRLGFYKPDPRIFAASLAQLGVHPREAVMVGDSITKDCAPARAMGMATVWLRHREFSGREAAPSNTADFTIDSLEELKDFEWLAG